MTTLWGSVVVLFVVTGSGFAMEPTPAQPSEGSPDVVTNASRLVTTRIIVKYVGHEVGRVENEEAARNAAEILTEIVGVKLRHVQLMSGNAQVVEVVGMENAQALETIKSIAARLEADPAVEYAEPNEIMQIQKATPEP